MDRKTVFTKTGRGLMEATGKTSHLSRSMRAILKEVDGKATVDELQSKVGKISRAKLEEALETLSTGDFVREFSTAAIRAASTSARTDTPPPEAPAASAHEDLDFTMIVPPPPKEDKQAEAAAKQKAQEAAAAAARTRAAAEAKAREESAARAKAAADAKAKVEAEARARAEAEARAKQEAKERARREAEEKTRREAEELRARLEEERKAREDAERERKAAAEKAQREAEELRAKLEEERKAREMAERRAQEEAERREKEEADRRKKEEERKAKEAAERKAKEEAERKAKEEAERKAKEEAERKAKEEAERKAKEEAERKAKEEAERKAKEEAERERKEAEARAEAERREKEVAERKAREAAERRAKEEAERKAKEEAERKAKEETERKAKEEAERERKEAEARAEAERREKEVAERKAREAAERERREAEESARREAEEQSQTSAKSGLSMDKLTEIDANFDAVSSPAWAMEPDAAQPLDGADGGMLREFEARERRQAEEKSRIEAQELARLKSEEEAKRAEEELERARQDESELARGLAPSGTPEKELDYAEAHARLEAQEAEETERHFAEMEKELEAEQAAGAGRRETHEHARMQDPEDISMHILATATAPALKTQAEPMPAARVERQRVKWGKPVALTLFLLLVLSLVLVHFVSFEGYIPRFEKLAGAYLQQPVKIRALHLSLVPQPHWRLNGVSVGSEGQLKVETVNASAGPGNMFGDTMSFSSIELESPVVSERAMAGLLFGKPAGQDFRVANLSVKNGKLDSKSFILPALDAKISMAESGAWRKIVLETPDHKTSLQLVPEGEGAQLEVDTNLFSLPFAPSFFLENFSAKGVIRRNELSLSELKGGISGGFLTGSAHLKWDADWSMTGEVKVRALDPSKFAPALFEEGALEGKAVYSMRAKSFDELFAAPRLEGTFEIRKGALLGVDLGRLLQGGGVGGKTTYTELTGDFVREAGKTFLRQIHLSAGPVRAAGNLDASADTAKHLNGRFAVDLKSPIVQAHSNLTLTGTLRDPRFSR